MILDRILARAQTMRERVYTLWPDRHLLRPMVMPVYEGTYIRPLGWSPACAVMTYPRALHAHAAKLKVHSTL
jgi:hypothetical protein